LEGAAIHNGHHQHSTNGAWSLVSLTRKRKWKQRPNVGCCTKPVAMASSTWKEFLHRNHTTIGNIPLPYSKHSFSLRHGINVINTR
jgi:hypothetical protein